MSHRIENAVYSTQEGAGWTGLGQTIPSEEANDPSAIAIRCKADYILAPREIFIKLDDGTFGAIPDRAAIVRNDTQEITGIVSDTRYNLNFRQPRDIFEAFRDELAAERLVISHAAVLAGGSRIAVCARLPQEHSFTVGGKNSQDRVDMYLTLSTGYDGKHGTRRTTGSERVVCHNTLDMNIADAIRDGKLRGISASQKLDADTLKKLVAGLAGDQMESDKDGADGKGLAGVIARAARSARAQRDAFNTMANQKISAVDLARYFGNVLGIDISQLNQVDPQGRPAISSKSKNMLKALAESYDTAPGSKWAHGNVWGALNAVTYYATHAKTCRDTSGAGLGAARYASNLDGDAAKLKARALVLAQSLVRVAA